MDPAALAGLRQPLTLTVGGLEYDVDPAPIAVWVAAAAEPIPLLGMLQFEPARRLQQRLLNDEVRLEELTDGWRTLLEEFTGWRWWSAERLLASVIAEWETFAGALAVRGVDALTQPLDMLLHGYWHLARQAAGSEAEIAKLQMKLHTPPAGLEEPAPPRWTAEEEGAAWLAAASAQGAARPSAQAPARLGSA